MRSKAAAILGAPIACWALYGCLTMADVNADLAGGIAVIWGVCWLALAHFGHAPRETTQVRHAGRRHGTGSGRAHWTGAVLASLFIPVPVYVFTVLFVWLQVMPVSAALPMLAILSMSAPAAFWWMALRPPTIRYDFMLLPIARIQCAPVTTVAHKGIIPPRITATRRAV